jgi:hypothetical protein
MRPSASELDAECVIFVGPTSHGDAGKLLLSPGLTVFPPVRHGDLDRLCESRAPGVIAIVDGVFHQAPPIGHREILRTIKRGWAVWGLSSMGAIRACELREYGMRGFGQVFARFSADPSLPDDEVTLIHEPEPPFRLFSEPMIHLREAAKALLSGEASEAVIRSLEAMYFGERTLPRFLELVRQHRPLTPPEQASLVQGFAKFRLKSHDLQDFLMTRPWA